MKRISIAMAVGLVLALLAAGCARDVVDAGPLEPDDTDTDDADDTDADDTDADDTVSDDTDDTDADDQAHDDQADIDPTPTDDHPSDAGNGDPSPSAGSSNIGTGGTATTTTSKIRLYFLAPGGETPARAGPFLVSVQREIPSTARIATATLRELVDGPSRADAALIKGISSAVPGETLVLGVTINDRLATVNLSREFESGGGSFSMLSRLAQMVYTVTQFPTVDRVQFELDGQPVTVFSGEGIVLDGPLSRRDYLDQLPTVFVDSPAAGAEIRSGARVTGMGAVFEATFQYRLETAAGTVLEEGFAMTSNGVGWGSFDMTVRFNVNERKPGTLTVWEYSAKDGSIQAKRVTPVILLP